MTILIQKLIQGLRSAMIQLFKILTFRDVNVFIFSKNDRVVMKTTTKNRKRNDRFLKVRFLKMVVFKTIVLIKIVVSLTIVNEERKPN